MSTIKVDDELKNELARLQSSSGTDKPPSYNELVKKALRCQALTPLLMRYVFSRVDGWNPYDLLSWFYEVEKAPLDRGLVEAYAELIVETGVP